MRIYGIFVASVLSYIMQLEPDCEELCDYFARALRLLAPGPGNWISPADLSNLDWAFSFPMCFKDPRWTSLAAKLRVIDALARDCQAKARELELALASYGKKPFGGWHERCYFVVLSRIEQQLERRGISRLAVRCQMQSNQGKSFQHMGLSI